MSRKKGMSRSDKLSAMQNMMMQSNDIWTLKELEKECPKKIGIQSMMVKDILQELADCDLVSSDKIGNGNFYWCFQSEARNRRQVEIDRLTAENAELRNEIETLEKEVKSLQKNREITDERLKLDEEIEQFEKQLEEISKDNEKLSKYSPENLRELQRLSQVAFDSANRWTDNIFACRYYAAKNLGIDQKDFNKVFEIDDSFDYLE